MRKQCKYTFILLMISSWLVVMIFRIHLNSESLTTLYDKLRLDLNQLHGSSKEMNNMRQLLGNLIDIRNNISRELNLKQQQLGKLECEKKKQFSITDTGGWCFNQSTEKSHSTDRTLVPALAEFLAGKFVASFGDGPGRYKQMLSDTGKLKGYDAYDGAPFSEETSDKRVTYLDLTLPQYGLPLYDWIISLEVAEHIPAKYERTFIDNVLRHAKEGIVLSWSRPGQGGYSHVNNRPFEYVNDTFSKFGFHHDENASTMLKQAASLGWLKNNINVYRRRHSPDSPSLQIMS